MTQPSPAANVVRALGETDAYLAPTLALTERAGRLHVAMRAVDAGRTQVIQGFFDRDAVESALEEQRVMEPAA